VELVSRLLVRLHKQLEEKIVWKMGLFLDVPGQDVKILVKASLGNELVVTIRGLDSDVARNALGVIAKEIDVVSAYYPGLNVRVEETASFTGIPMKKIWWKADVDGSWETHKIMDTDSIIRRRVVVQGGACVDKVLYEKLSFSLQSLGGNISRVEEAYFVSNPFSSDSFESFRANQTHRRLLSPSKFNLHDWDKIDGNQSARVSMRSETLDLLKIHCSRFDWNDISKLVGDFSHSKSKLQLILFVVVVVE